MIVLFSDFGLNGPYIGQVKAVLHARAPGVAVIDLFSDAPAYDPHLSAYLLAAYAKGFAPGTVFLGVVDPGVGSDRPCVIVRAGDCWFVGPGNGLFEIVARRAAESGGDVSWWTLDAVPATASASFHGRDVFAPAAAALALNGGPPPGWQPDERAVLCHSDWPDDLARIVYIDGFGNAMTGLRAGVLADDAKLSMADKTLFKARTFSDVPKGVAFWYENGNGLVEVAVNQGRAADLPGVWVGAEVTV